MSTWLRSLVIVTISVTVPAAPPFLALEQGAGGGCEENGGCDDEEHEGGCGGGGGSGGSGGGGHKGPGNNLSVPVVFAEGYGLHGLPTSVDAWLRPRPGDVNPGTPVYLNPNETFAKDGQSYFPQQTTSHWQADWRDGVAGAAEPAIVNWGDNLTHQYWTTGSMIRVETVLFQDPADTMTAYSLERLAGKRSKPLLGTTGQTYPSTYRTVFTVTARFTIEKLIARAGPVDTSVPRITRAVYDSFTDVRPRGGCNAQVNGAGSVVFSYSWPIRQWPIPEAQKLGWWRITFSLDPIAQYTVTVGHGGTPQTFTVARNAYFEALDAADTSDETLFSPALRDSTTSVLEIELMARRGGRPPDESYTLTIAPPANGSVVALGNACGAMGTACTTRLPAGTYVPLEAYPAPGYELAAWSGAADCLDGVVILKADTTCSATFVLHTGPPPAAGYYRLRVVPPTGGTVLGAGIVCGDTGSTCFVDLPAGIVVGLEAVPSAGSTFIGWSAECPDGMVTMSTNRVCAPTFTGPTPAPPTGSARLSIVRPAGGTIYAAGIVCGDAGTACVVDLPLGTTLGLDAAPSPGFTFAGWSGNGCGPTVTLTSALTCTPTFRSLASHAERRRP